MNHTPTAALKVNRLGEQTPIEDYIENVAVTHLEAIAAMFSAISQLGDDHQTSGALAAHGRYVAQMLSNELDGLRSRMVDERTAASDKPADTASLPPNVTPLH